MALSIFLTIMIAIVVAVLLLVEWDDEDPIELDHHVCSQMRRSGHSEEQIKAFMKAHDGHYDRD